MGSSPCPCRDRSLPPQGPGQGTRMGMQRVHVGPVPA
jgi:hypothetical protein